MGIVIKKIQNIKEIYDYMINMIFPYNYQPDDQTWETSFLYDTDGNGKTLFADLDNIGAYLEGQWIRYIQYGMSAFGFDPKQESSSTISYPIIRNFYFSSFQQETGEGLWKEVVNALSTLSEERIYAFFHYFGMSCYGRHGKLFEKYPHIHT